MPVKITRISSVVSVGVLYLLGNAAGQTGNLFRHAIINPLDLRWVENPARPGQRRAVLFGDPDRPGPYTYRVRFPPDTPNPPHTHNDDRQVTVLSGSWYLGQGDTLDRQKAVKVGSGTFFTEPGNSVHYNFTGAEEVIVQVSGMGPTSTKYLR